jgi:hypothetical protein
VARRALRGPPLPADSRLHHDGRRERLVVNLRLQDDAPAFSCFGVTRRAQGNEARLTGSKGAALDLDELAVFTTIDDRRALIDGIDPVRFRRPHDDAIHRRALIGR